MRTAYNRVPNVNLCTMGGSQSGEAEREVTVEEQERDDGQPQIIVRAAASHTECVWKNHSTCLPSGDPGLPPVCAGPAGRGGEGRGNTEQSSTSLPS